MKDTMSERYTQTANAAYATEVENGLIDIRKIFVVLRRWWWLIALIMTAITLMTAVMLFRTTPIYKATSLLEIRQEERNVIDVSEIESVIVDQEFLNTQIELLQSESLIAETVQSLNLLTDPYLAPLGSESWAGLTRDQRLSTVVNSFENKLTVSVVGRSLLIRVSFEHPDANKAALITNALTENYINTGLARKFNATKFAREFLEDRLRTVRTSLEKAERELVAYATQNDIIIVDGEDTRESSGSLDMTALKTLNEALTTASLERVSAQTAYEQSESSSFSADVLSNQALARLRADRVALNSEYLEKQAIFMPGFPEMVELKARIDLFDQEIATKTGEIVQAQREQLKREFEQAQVREQDLRARVAALKVSVVDVREKSIDYNIFKRQVETERTQYDALLQRLKEVSVSDDLGSNLVEVVDTAQAPRNPFKPNRMRGIALALLLSGALGFGVAYILELMDNHVKGPEDVKSKLGQILMGAIPLTKTPDDLLQTLSDPQSGLAESYGSLRTNLQYSGPDGGPRVIQMTSTRSGEGKSVTSLAIALRFAGAGKKTLLIDADMRLPTFLANPAQPTIGLSGVLTTRTDIAREIQTTTHNNLDLLPSGSGVPNPAELLSSARFDELLAHARSSYDYVVVDGPPVLGLADAPVIGAKVDATLMIVESKGLRTPNIKAAIERLSYSGTKILGVVLTKYKAQSKGYGDYYQYAYGDAANTYKTPKKQTKTKTKRKFTLG